MDLGKIAVDKWGRFEVNIKKDWHYLSGYKTRTYRSFDRAKKRSDKVKAKEQARLDKVAKGRELIRNSERSS